MSKKSPRDDRSFAFGAVFTVSFLLLFGGGLANQHANENFLVIGLFALPVLAQLIGLVLIHLNPQKDIKSFSIYYACMMFACVFASYTLWIIYNIKSLSSFFGLCFLSVISLSSIVIIAAFVVVMTIAIMQVSNADDSNVDNAEGEFRKKLRKRVRLRERLVNLKTDVQKEPFLALLLFFSAFLCISYLFGLAFAFYDKTLPQKGKPALYMRNLYPDQDDGKNSDPKDYWKITRENPILIYFEKARAIPDIKIPYTKDISQAVWKKKVNMIREVVDRRTTNFDNLKQIVERIKGGTEDNNRIRVVLIGRADDTSTTGTPYSSNYELSQARALNVESEILEKLTGGVNKWHNIEWVVIPLSNEPAVLPVSALFSSNSSSNPGSPKTGQDSANNRVVEVKIEPISEEASALQMQRMQSEKNILSYKQLDLMDYIYFANYTITTTGYGDIMPTTPYSKFLCSLANICEVFFLVVFFNTLLSLKKSGGDTTHAATVDSRETSKTPPTGEKPPGINKSGKRNNKSLYHKIREFLDL